jgi:hypothetical protein
VSAETQTRAFFTPFFVLLLPFFLLLSLLLSHNLLASNHAILRSLPVGDLEEEDRPANMTEESNERFQVS